MFVNLSSTAVLVGVFIEKIHKSEKLIEIRVLKDDLININEILFAIESMFYVLNWLPQ